MFENLYSVEVKFIITCRSLEAIHIAELSLVRLCVCNDGAYDFCFKSSLNSAFSYFSLNRA